MKSNAFTRILAFILCLVLLCSVCLAAQAAAKKAKTAEELGYLPPAELLQEDGQTIKFNDPAVQSALEQQYAYLMEPDGTFLKDSLKEVGYLAVGVEVYDDTWEAYTLAWEQARDDESYTPKAAQVDLSVLQFCAKLYSLEVCAEKVTSLAALGQSKEKYKHLTFIGGRDLDLEPCASISNLYNLSLVGCTVASYEPLFKCKKLDYLTLSGKAVTDISFALEIPKLTSLTLYEAPNADLSPLLEKKRFDSLALDMTGAKMDDIRWQLAKKCRYGFDAYNVTELTPEIVDAYLSGVVYLWISRSDTADTTEAMDYSALKGAKKLTSLGFFGDNLADLSFAAELSKLKYFYLSNCTIGDARGMFDAPKLSELSVWYSTVESWGSFEEPIKAKKLSEIEITASGLRDVSFVNGLSLKYLWLTGNDVMDIAPLAQAKKIQNLSLANNPVADFAPLAEVKGLKLVQHNSSAEMPELKKVEIVEGEEPWYSY